MDLPHCHTMSNKIFRELDHIHIPTWLKNKEKLMVGGGKGTVSRSIGEYQDVHWEKCVFCCKIQFVPKVPDMV